MNEGPQIVEFLRIGGVVTAIGILAATWVVNQLLQTFFERLGDRFTEQRLRIRQAGTFLRFFFYLCAIAAGIALSLELSNEVVLALGGTLAVTVGFAFKDLAASIIAGVTILIDKPFQVGDRVSFGGVYGEVREMGLRSVRLVTLDDDLVTIPNNKFLTEITSTSNAGELDMMVQVDVYIGVDQDLATAKRIVSEAVTSTQYAYLRKPWTVQVAQLIQDSYVALRLRAKFYVLDVQYESAVRTDVHERVLTAFREAGIQPPAILHRTTAETPDPAP